MNVLAVGVHTLLDKFHEKGEFGTFQDLKTKENLEKTFIEKEMLKSSRILYQIKSLASSLCDLCSNGSTGTDDHMLWEQ